MDRVITNREINVAFVKDKPYLVKESINAHGLSPIMHMFLMDASYMAFTKYIKVKNFSFYKKKCVKKCLDAYKDFFKSFWIPFDEQQQNYLDDKLNEFEKYIEHNIFLCEIATMELDNSIPAYDQGVLASLVTANKISIDANATFGNTYRPLSREICSSDRLIDHKITAITNGTCDLAEALHFQLEYNGKRVDRLNKAREALMNKIYLWVVKDYENDVEVYKEALKNNQVEAPKSYYTPGCLLNGAKLKVRTSIL